MSVHVHVHAWYLQSGEKGFSSPELELLHLRVLYLRKHPGW